MNQTHNHKKTLILAIYVAIYVAVVMYYNGLNKTKGDQNDIEINICEIDIEQCV